MSVDLNTNQVPTKNFSDKKTKQWAWVGAALSLFLIVGVYIVWTKDKDKITVSTIVDVVKDNYKPTGVFAASFAEYKESPVTITPNVPAYKINKDLGNVTNLSDFDFQSNQVKQLLAQNGFAVVKGGNREFFPLYEVNRYSLVPNFITTDSMLHNYHLIFDHLLKNLEEEKLATELKGLSGSMMAESINQYNALKGTEWETAAKRNVGFFTVGSKLLDNSVAVLPVVQTEVEKEVALITAHRGVDESPVMNIEQSRGAVLGSPQGALSLDALKEDYSQYVARGHYTKTEQLQNYFKAMMWYGRMTFRLKNEDEIKSAILITLALSKENNQVGWNTIYEPVNFFVGKSDDITFYQFKDLLGKVYGPTVTVQTIQDKNKFTTFVNETKTLEPPQINSMPIFNAAIQPDREQEIKGFRFMGQRFTIDASIFQRLIYREVEDRMMPKSLDIPAALGSAEGLNLLTQMGETKYGRYSENMAKMQSYLSGLDTKTWTQNLYWGWLYALRPLVEEKAKGYPLFMNNTAWVRKELNTFLGSWTELKHDTILYAKQAYAELGGGGPEEKDDRGYVEPNPNLYGRLASLLRMTSEGLENRDLLSDTMKENLANMEQLALSLKIISEKELTNQPLNDEEYELIRSYGGQLEHFWFEVNKEEMLRAQSNQQTYLQDNPAALIADVATDPNGQVLEEAIGHINEIYVVVPVAGKLKIAKGGVYSYYEFTWPMSDRLTDEKWRGLLDAGEAPEPPAWTNAFLVK